MQRRGFIRNLTGGAIGWAVGGWLVDAAATHAYANPVPFVRDPTASGFDTRPDELFAVDAAATARDQAATYPQSVASGDPNPHGVVLWTRIAPAMITGLPGTLIGWQIATDASFGDASLVLEGVALVRASRDHTVKLPIAHPALAPFSIYYYRFLHAGVVSRTGRFKTMPRPGASLDALRLGYVVCQDYSNGYYTAYRLLAQEEVDAVVHLGDYIYEYLDDGVGGPNNGPVRVVPPFPSGASYPQNLDDYRHLYQVYRADPDIQAMHERFAMIQLWDDHEFYNDCHQDYHEDTNTPPLTATTPQPRLRQQANQAWSEHGLADVAFDPALGWEQSIRVYRNFCFGDLVDLVVTDERLYRDGPPCGDLEAQRYETTACAERTDPARTMLGAAQKRWFLDTVTGSKATWKLWANEVMLCQYLLNAKTREFFDLDEWDGYPVERAEILGAIRDARVDNFVVLSGDAHLYLASYLRTDFDDPTEPPMGVELMVGAISSGNYLDAGVDKPVPLSAPAAVHKMAATKLPIDSFGALVISQNPHIQFWNGSTWGYAVLSITRQSLTCDFRVASTIKQPGGTLQELATFTVPSGKVALIAS